MPAGSGSAYSGCSVWRAPQPVTVSGGCASARAIGTVLQTSSPVPRSWQALLKPIASACLPASSRQQVPPSLSNARRLACCHFSQATNWRVLYSCPKPRLALHCTGDNHCSAGKGTAVAASPPLHPQSGGCARAAPYDAAARRGLRAPDVAAIAVAKRAYLRKVKRYPLTSAGAIARACSIATDSCDVQSC